MVNLICIKSYHFKRRRKAKQRVPNNKEIRLWIVRLRHLALPRDYEIFHIILSELTQTVLLMTLLIAIIVCPTYVTSLGIRLTERCN